MVNFTAIEIQTQEDGKNDEDGENLLRGNGDRPFMELLRPTRRRHLDSGDFVRIGRGRRNISFALYDLRRNRQQRSDYRTKRLVDILRLVYFSVEAIFDTTKGNGKRGGYGNRAGKYTTLDSMVGLAHDFDLGETLGFLGVDFSYMYEYLPRHDGEVGDTQYLNLELSLGDLWLEPAFAIERDLMADDGTYAYFELGHTFELSESVTLRPSVGQGLGNSLRTRGYFSELEKVEGFDHGGMMDTTLRIDLEYALADWLTFGAYVAYHDYLFDGNMREAAAAYNGEWGASENKTWNLVGGLSITATF